MAEGFFRSQTSDEIEIYSAGTIPQEVNPIAIQVMQEIGIDISTHHSDSVEVYKEIEFDYVITVCDKAKESCPYIAAKKMQVHEGFEDPAISIGSKVEILDTYRKVRDQIKDFTEQFVKDNDLGK